MGTDLAAARAYQSERNERVWQEREERRSEALAAARAAILDVTPHFPAVSRVYLFGSVTRPGVFRLRSDLDIGVEGVLSAEDSGQDISGRPGAVPGFSRKPVMIE